ncbi:S-adenosyl-L-methionine-dependent methyltransferase [Annulohypoxylon maeteangense]|uniref:S-adenosyl-L-methionine-dependent methyltransferase n=1 Tax=Annulohypoxylon maeteangense TaxID=1927788 RepID=UPI002007E063|nr:S-adenosyl-L-methionine-dependent methyltransferase [Annulohypoxylon maeteangense]KAI0887772.1 S-adenosyl-L-methionine-dependent methyltransferase [Annulohypoxylon maeteangense]
MEPSETQSSESTTRGDPSLLNIAENILEQTKAVTRYLQNNNLAEPTFYPKSSQPPTTDEYLQLQSSLRTSLEDLQRLVEGPKRFLRSFVTMGYDIAALQVALDFDFFTLVPPDGDISMEDLAEKGGLDLDRTSRVVRMLITHRLFDEKRPGYVSHSASSLVLLEDEELRCTVQYSFDEMLKAAADSNVSLKQYPSESDSTHCPFYTRHGLPLFQYYAKYPDKAARFAKAMAGATRMDRHIRELRDCFSWGDLKGTVVDVGGGSGHISMSLARSFPHLNFVVQDESTNMLDEGRAILTDDVRERITFAQQSFFEPQPVREDDPAAAYLLRQCAHNWCDRDLVTIFRSIVPGLESSGSATPFLINDIVMPEPGESWPRLLERDIRQIDMIMLIGLGAKQRTKREFEALLKKADARYEILKVHATGPMGLLEVYLRQ